MKLRLLDLQGKCVHELDVEEDPNANTILHYAPTGKHYVYHDAGGDEEGNWEEWMEAEIVSVNVTLHSELTGGSK